jgi:hypothetical protein
MLPRGEILGAVGSVAQAQRPQGGAQSQSASCETMFARCKVAISSKEGPYIASRKCSRRGMCVQSGSWW